MGQSALVPHGAQHLHAYRYRGAKIGSAINQIRVVSNLGIWIRVGSSSVTATANSDTYLLASTVEYLTVSPGQAVAAISTSTSTGFFVVTEMH